MEFTLEVARLCVTVASLTEKKSDETQSVISDHEVHVQKMQNTVPISNKMRELYTHCHVKFNIDKVMAKRPI